MHECEATYDELNRRHTLIEIDRLNAQNRLVTQYEYDSRSQRVWAIDPMGNPTRWTFDGLGRMVKRERALTLGATINQFTTAQVTQWAFDKNDRLTGHTDDGPNTTSWAFDALDRPTSMTYPDSSSASYVYDANSNVTQVTDPAGSVFTDVFDALDRNTSRSITRGAGVGGTTGETRAYDALSRMLTNADNDYQIEYEHEVNGLRSIVFSETQSYVGASPSPLTVTRTHDAVGNTLSEAYPSGMTLARSWNPINRLQAVTDTVNTIASFTYWGNRPKGIAFGNGTTQTTSYTGFRGEVQQIHHQTSTQGTIVQLDYGYDLNHDRVFERFGSAGASGDGFAYDRLRRLTNAWMGSATPSNPVGATYTKKIDYNYDDDGNRTSVVVTPWGAGPGSTSYNTNNLYQYTLVGGTTHQWDGNGNLQTDGTYRYKYDYLNQLIEMRDATGANIVAAYRYDPAGRRVEKSVAATGLVERFVYSGLETVCVYDVGVGWKQDFVFGDTIDSILMLQQADILDYDGDQNTTKLARHYYHRNALGSVMEITDPAQAVAVSYRYNPYGKATITVGGQVQATDPLGQHWAFTARYLDSEVGLMHYRARAYAPRLSRFTQRDPLRVIEGPNDYEYVNSSPVMASDPLGRGLQDYEWKSGRVAEFLWAWKHHGLANAVTAGYAATLASKLAMSSAIPNHRGLGPQNALRHCLWACLMVHGCGEDVARSILDHHELVAVEQSTTELEMDEHNNERGIECAKSGQKCYDCCVDRIESGHAVWGFRESDTRKRPWPPCAGPGPAAPVLPFPKPEVPDWGPGGWI